MNPRASFRHLGLSTRWIALFVATVFIAGCATSPKLSLTSPSTWPGVKQVAGVGHKIGGWAAEKSRSKREREKTRAAAVARRESSRANLGDESNGKLRTIFTQATRGGSNQPSDPFLAETAGATPRVESVAHSSDATQNGLPTNDRRASAFTPASLSVDGPPVPTFEDNTPTTADVNPFADLAGSRSGTDTQTNEQHPDRKTFADRIDTQLAQLRQQTDDSDTSHTTKHMPIDTNPLRDAILGDAAQTRILALPDDVAGPADEVKKATEVARESADHAIIRLEDSAGELLPEWARQPAADPASRESMPADDSTPDSDRLIGPMGEALTVGPSEKPAASERIRIATNAGQLPPTAIEIVPSRAPLSAQSPPELPMADADAAQRVELLPPPSEALDIGDRASVDEIGDTFGGMIVKSETLPSGFAEWRKNGARATLRTNRPLDAQPVSSLSTESVPARLAVNSRGASTSRATIDAVTVSEQRPPFVAQSHLLRAIPPAAIVDTEASAETITPASESLLFLPTDERERTTESSLEAVSWDPESEPGAAAESSLFGSTAVIGLFIGLACLTGLAWIRRKHSAA